MTVIDNSEVFKKYHDMVRLVDERISKGYYGDNYQDSPVYHDDLEKLGQAYNDALRRTIENLKRAQDKMHRDMNTKVTENERRDAKYLKKHLDARHKETIEHNRKLREMLEYTVERKQQYRSLKESLNAVLEKKKSGKRLTKDDKKVVEDVLRF